MSGNEIREKIIQNNKRIEEVLNKCIFTLNREVLQLREENRRLQSQCDHEFNELGFCIYCDKEKE